MRDSCIKSMTSRKSRECCEQKPDVNSLLFTYFANFNGEVFVSSKRTYAHQVRVYLKTQSSKTI